MSVPLLTTKLYFPPARTNLVPRARLIERLNAGVKDPFTLISAPAGSGKTTLLSEWRSGPGARYPVAWLSLDDGDNDPARFFSYLAAALGTLQTNLTSNTATLLHSPGLPPIETVITSLVNDLEAFEQDFVMVLDDFHVITERTIHQALEFLLSHQPPRVHLVILTRADPPLPLARLRARGQIAELRAIDLRFSPAESETFLNGVMKLGLTQEDVRKLDDRAEGWIAGLKMAALSMRERSDRSAFIASFTGSNRLIYDYLFEEILACQSEPIRHFLIYTSILDQMTASLCDAVTGIEDSQATLERLDRANLFLVPLDDQRRWYRYHHLFADLLRNQLHRHAPDQIPELHRHASRWYEQHGLIGQAASHALAGGDVEHVAALVITNATALIETGELGVLMRRLESLPREIYQAQIWVNIAYAWTLAYAGSLDRIGPVLQEIASRASTFENGREQQRILGHVAAIQAYRSFFRGEILQAMQLAQEALHQLPDEETAARALSATTLGTACIYCDDFTGAEQALRMAVVLGETMGSAQIYLVANSWLAYLFSLKGQIGAAERICQAALASTHTDLTPGSEKHPAVASLLEMLSRVALERNDLQTALVCARDALELARRWGQADTQIVCSLQMATVLRAAGDSDGAHHLLGVTRALARRVSLWYDKICATVQAGLFLLDGRLTEADQIIQEFNINPDDEVIDDVDRYLVLAELLMARGQWQAAVPLLSRLLDRAEASGLQRNVMIILIGQAIAARALGDNESAYAWIGRALSIAAPEGYIHVFIVHGETVRQLLWEVSRKGLYSEHANQILAAWGEKAVSLKFPGEAQDSDARQAAPQMILPPLPLVEALSARELQVLRLLNSPLTTPQIGETLYLSTNTVRTHIKNLYAKLDVHSRLEAIERAKALKLI